MQDLLLSVPPPTPLGPVRPTQAPYDEVVAKAAAEAADYFIADALGCMTGVGRRSARTVLDSILRPYGNPSDPVARILIEQLYLTNHLLIQIAADATHRSDDKRYEVLAAHRGLLGELRKMALTIKELGIFPGIDAQRTASAGDDGRGRDASSSMPGRAALSFELDPQQTPGSGGDGKGKKRLGLISADRCPGSRRRGRGRKSAVHGG